MNKTLPMITKITADDWEEYHSQSLRDWFATQTTWKPRFAVRHMIEHTHINVDTLPALKSCGSFFRCNRCKVPDKGFWSNYHNDNAIGDRFITCRRDPRCDHIGRACLHCPDIELCKYLFDELPQKITNKRRVNKVKRTKKRKARINLTAK